MAVVVAGHELRTEQVEEYLVSDRKLPVGVLYEIGCDELSSRLTVTTREYRSEQDPRTVVEARLGETTVQQLYRPPLSPMEAAQRVYPAAGAVIEASGIFSSNIASV